MLGVRRSLVRDLTRSAFGAIFIEKKNGTAWGRTPYRNGASRLGLKRYDLRARGAMKRRWFYWALLILGALPPCVGYAQTAGQVPDTMEVRVMACAPCHGAKGEGTNNTYFPRLAGKPAGISRISFSLSTLGASTTLP
jgi:cytochrome c553